ncbi:hypothetical protein AX15_005230 [Amanita polypyramis BW_CC]|nr:hypothetical protein AX15_005230 [Amanita polypyramis BW_CC]
MTVEEAARPLLRFTTFGHRNGLLNPAPDLLFDLRSLPNPPKALRSESHRTGLLEHMQEWLFSLPLVRQQFQDIRNQILHSLCQAERDSVAAMYVGLGCNLGRNRSVTIAEALAVLDWGEWRVEVDHRDRCLHHVGKDRPRAVVSLQRNESSASLAWIVDSPSG